MSRAAAIFSRLLALRLPLVHLRVDVRGELGTTVIDLLPSDARRSPGLQQMSPYARALRFVVVPELLRVERVAFLGYVWAATSSTVGFLNPSRTRARVGLVHTVSFSLIGVWGEGSLFL